MDELIKTGELFLERENFDKSRLKVWQLQVKRTLTAEYDEEIADEFDNILSGGFVMRPRMDLYSELYRPRVVSCISFLRSLTTSEMPSGNKTAPEIGSLPQNITISGGTVVFGDHNTVNNITVRDILEALEQDIQAKTPASSEKNKTLIAVKALTTNETFASVVGQTLGTFLSHIVK